LYKSEETESGEALQDGQEQMYVYEDEIAEARMSDNFDSLLRVLFDQLMKKGNVTLAYLNYLYSMKFSEEIFHNGDYYAFLVHLSQKDYYDLDALKQHQDTFLEGMMDDFLKKNGQPYQGLKFRLVYLPEETLSVSGAYEMTNIRFERVED
jgi:hypothetical protein